MSATVGIVGLGWLGSALYEYLAAQGISLWGTRTTTKGVGEMRSLGIQAFHLVLNSEPQDESWRDWFRCRNLVINIPPNRRDQAVERNYTNQISQLLRMAKVNNVEKVIFISSTSVFGASKGVVDDDAPVQPDTATARALVACENLMKQKWEGVFAIVRFAGLYGPERHPGKFFAGRTNVPNGDAPVNFIHRDDAVRVIDLLIRKPRCSDVFNACAPAHPPKKDFYHRAALDIGLAPPTFLAGGADGKIIQCIHLANEGYVFQRAALEL